MEVINQKELHDIGSKTHSGLKIATKKTHRDKTLSFANLANNETQVKHENLKSLKAKMTCIKAKEKQQ